MLIHIKFKALSFSHSFRIKIPKYEVANITNPVQIVNCIETKEIRPTIEPINQVLGINLNSGTIALDGIGVKLGKRLKKIRI